MTSIIKISPKREVNEDPIITSLQFPSGTGGQNTLSYHAESGRWKGDDYAHREYESMGLLIKRMLVAGYEHGKIGEPMHDKVSIVILGRVEERWEFENITNKMVVTKTSPSNHSYCIRTSNILKAAYKQSYFMGRKESGLRKFKFNLAEDIPTLVQSVKAVCPYISTDHIEKVILTISSLIETSHASAPTSLTEGCLDLSRLKPQLDLF
jgi:hypothetical protein